MDIGEWKATPELNDVYRRARQLGLETNLAELEAYGFTIVEPEQAAPGAFSRRLLAATLALVGGEDADKGGTCARADRPIAGRQLYHLLERDAVFVEAMMNPAVLTLAKYLVGASCRLSKIVAFVKDGPAAPTIVQCDSVGVPPPLPSFGSVCNASWILTDYTKDRGTFFVVPGSHRYCRHPTPLDQPHFLGGPGDDDIGIPITAGPRSLFIFHDNTWHGAYPKLDNHVRVHVAALFCRNYMDPAQDFTVLPDDFVNRNGLEFARLIGRQAWQGHGSDGPDLDRVRAADRIKITPSA